MGRTNRGAWLGLALLALSCIAAAPGLSQTADTPWLGVSMQSLNDGLRDGMSYQGQGVLVSRVVDGSPADRAGLRKGDVIVRINGRSVESPDELTRIVRESRVGETVSLGVYRDGSRRTLSARLGSWPEGNETEVVPEDVPPPRAKARSEDRGDTQWYDGKDFEDHKELKDEDLKEMKDLKDLKGLEELDKLDRLPRMDLDGGGRAFLMNGLGRGRLGVRAEDLNADLAPYFDAPQGSGALVMEVLKDTPADRAGIKAGDVIVRVGDQRISDADDLVRTLREAPEGRTSVTVIRRGNRRTLEPVLEAAPRAGRGGRGSMSFGPGNRRMIVRDRNGTRVYGPDTDSRDEELQQLREEVRRLREKLEERNQGDYKQGD